MNKLLFTLTPLLLSGCTSKWIEFTICTKPNGSEERTCKVEAKFKALDDCEHHKLTYMSLIDYRQLEREGRTEIRYKPYSDFGTFEIRCEN